MVAPSLGPGQDLSRPLPFLRKGPPRQATQAAPILVASLVVPRQHLPGQEIPKGGNGSRGLGKTSTTSTMTQETDGGVAAGRTGGAFTGSTREQGTWRASLRSGQRGGGAAGRFAEGGQNGHNQGVPGQVQAGQECGTSVSLANPPSQEGPGSCRPRVARKPGRAAAVAPEVAAWYSVPGKRSSRPWLPLVGAVQEPALRVAPHGGTRGKEE